MNYFRCTVGGSGKGNTVTVTCAEEFAGLTITLSKTGKTYTKTCPSTAPYVVTFYGVENGTYTVSCMVDGQTYSETVVVQDISCVLNYGFNWKIWVDTASQLDSSDYASLDEVLADEKALRELFLEHACVDYMASMGTSNEDLETVINNDLCAKWINLSDYALDFLHANEVIADLMDEADKYGYGEWALMPQVPKMTSNTAPIGEVDSYRQYSGNDAYKAFDSNSTTHYSNGQNRNTSDYLQYKFVNPICVKRFSLLPYSATDFAAYSIKASNDGENWTTLFSDVNESSDLITQDINNEDSYLYYRVTNDSDANSWWTIKELQFYAWAPKGNVPVMTSNTAPYGTAVGTGDSVQSNNAYAPFNGRFGGVAEPLNGTISYKFTNPVMIKKFTIASTINGGNNYPTLGNFDIIARNNDSDTWVVLASKTWPYSQTANGIMEFNIENDTYYMQYGVKFTSQPNASGWPGIRHLQFYGRELKVSIPIMTSDTAPYGDMFHSGYTSASGRTGDWAWNAFDNNASTAFVLYTPSTPLFEIGYKFPSKVMLKCLLYQPVKSGESQGSLLSHTDTFYKSMDGTNWEVLATKEITNSTAKSLNVVSFEPTELLYIKYSHNGATMSNNYAQMAIFGAYGLDYSEKEFEVGTTKKWLYDHGVELETITAYTDNGTVTKSDSDIYILPAQNNNAVAEIYAPSVDMSDYSRYVISFSDRYSANTTMDVLSTAPRTLANWSTSGVVVAERAITSITDNPRHITLDVTALNSSYYPAIVIGGNSSQSRYASLNELWLE